MQIIVGFFTSLALLGFVVAGLAAILGVVPVRQRALGFAVLMIGIALVVPLVEAVAARCLAATAGAFETTRSGMPSLLPALFVIGHLVLAASLVRRRLRRGERGRRELADLDRARTRERTRLAPQPEEPDE